jgi:hypothetical protein
MKVSAKLKDQEAVVVEVAVPETLAAAVQKYGEAAVYAAVKRAIVSAVQVSLRAGLTKKLQAAEIARNAAAVTLGSGTRKPRQTALEKARAILAGLSPEDRKAILAAK